MIIFLYGENTFLAKKKLKELKNKFVRDVDKTGSSIVVVDGEKTNIKEINKKFAPASLLSKKRMIIVEDIFLNKTKGVFEDIKNYLKEKEGKNDDNIIIFFDSNVKIGKKNVPVVVGAQEKTLLKEPLKLFSFLNSQKFVQEFKMLSSFYLVKWVKERFKEAGVKISSQAVNNLIGFVGNDLWQIDNEVKKLISYKDKIETQDIEELVSGKFNDNIFALSDAISARDKQLTFKLLEEQFKTGVNLAYLLSMIIRQFKILLQIKQALDLGLPSGAIAKRLRLHPFVVQKSINQASGFEFNNLKQIFSALVNIEYKMKIGNDIKLDLEVFLNKELDR